MANDSQPPPRQIRAAYTDATITVYQAYPARVAEPALAAGRFVSPFKLDRMTWIKPSFLWMMYRCGWGTKADQERVLAIEHARSGFEWALAHACLSHFDAAIHASHDAWKAELRRAPVRVQWDPERSISLLALPHRSIQIGLSGEAVTHYVGEWTRSVVDVTPLAREMHELVQAGDLDAARALLPHERVYPLGPDLRARLGVSSSPGAQADSDTLAAIPRAKRQRRPARTQPVITRPTRFRRVVVRHAAVVGFGVE